LQLFPVSTGSAVERDDQCSGNRELSKSVTISGKKEQKFDDPFMIVQCMFFSNIKFHAPPIAESSKEFELEFE
jgi:hypothetical protein